MTNEELEKKINEALSIAKSARIVVRNHQEDLADVESKVQSCWIKIAHIQHDDVEDLDEKIKDLKERIGETETIVAKLVTARTAGVVTRVVFIIILLAYWIWSCHG